MEDGNSQELFEFLAQMVKDGELKSPKHTILPLKEFKIALEQSSKGFKNTKYILDMSY